MKSSEREEYIRYRLKKADETYEVALLLVKNEKWNSAINRLYYAAFYALSGLLVGDGIQTRSHSGVKTRFFLDYVKTGKIEVRLGKVYADLFDWRQKGDYGDFFDFAEADVHSILEPTLELIKAIKKELEMDLDE